MDDGIAHIEDDECIRCGRCHDVCPQDAVRHDSERIPQQIEANLAWTRRLLEHFDTAEEKRVLLDRLGRHFAKEKRIAEQTIERLSAISKGF